MKFKNPLIARYQREAMKELAKIGIKLPDLETVRKNYTTAPGKYKSTRERVFASVAQQGNFVMKRGGTIPGLEHFQNIKTQNRINNQIRANLSTLKTRPSKFYKPFNLTRISGTSKQVEETAYRRAVATMTGKTTSKLLGRYVGGYRGLITSIVNSFGVKRYLLIQDILNILYGQLRVIEAAWTSKNPKLTPAVQAAAALLNKIESLLPDGVSAKVMYSSDEIVIKVYIIQLTEAVGLNPDDYMADIMAIMRDTTGTDGASMA